MLDLPAFGQRVKVWPMPGRKVQTSDFALMDGGAFMGPEGMEIEWSASWHRRLLSGDIIFHDPRPVGGSSKLSTPAPLAIEREVQRLDAEDAAIAAKRKQASRLLEEAEEADKAVQAQRAAAAKQARKLADDLTTKKPAKTGEEL